MLCPSVCHQGDPGKLFDPELTFNSRYSIKWALLEAEGKLTKERNLCLMAVERHAYKLINVPTGAILF